MQTINSNEINFFDVWIIENKEILSSFSNIIKSKYSVLTPLWQYFNFGSMWCSGDSYWNLLLETDIEDLAEKDILANENPIRNWWKIQKVRFTKKDFSMKIKVYAKDMKSLEKDIRNIKKLLNLDWCKMIKTEKELTTEINATLVDVTFWNLTTKWTDCELIFISYDPFFKTANWSTKSFYNISWNYNWSLLINDSDEPPLITTIIRLKTVTWTITNIAISLDWYTVSCNTSITAPTIIIFDWLNEQITIWWVEVLDWQGKFVPFPLGVPKTVAITLTWWSAKTSDLYMSYDNFYK